MTTRFAWDVDALALLWHWIAERQRAFHNRRVLQRVPPWTEDEVVAGNHFTNVYRELDPGTSWLVRHVLENWHLPPADRAFLAVAYRLFGTEEVFSWLGVQVAHDPGARWPGGHPMRPGSFDEAWLAGQLQELMDSGVQAFTPAYMVSNYGRSEPKSQVVANVLAVAAEGWKGTWRHVREAATRQQAYNALSRVYGIGNFLAFQVLVDLCYPIPGNHGKGLLPFSNDDWIAAGPGAVRGLRYLLGADFSPAGGRDDQAVAALVRMHRPALDALDMPWLRDEAGKPIPVDRSNMQNCLCEYSKYRRLLREAEAGQRGGGRKRGFDPDDAFGRDLLAAQQARTLPPGSIRHAVQGEIAL